MKIMVVPSSVLTNDSWVADAYCVEQAQGRQRYAAGQRMVKRGLSTILNVVARKRDARARQRRLGIKEL